MTKKKFKLNTVDPLNRILSPDNYWDLNNKSKFNFPIQEMGHFVLFFNKNDNKIGETNY